MAKRAKTGRGADRASERRKRGPARGKRGVKGAPGAAARPAPESRAPARGRDVRGVRELFWQNVMREILTNLSVVSGRKAAAGVPALEAGPGAESRGNANAAAPGPSESPAPAAQAEASEEMELFDGRLAVITRQGQRVPIAEVFPLFACGIATPAERVLSMEVECTVFQIRTPGGEVFTLPLEEMRAFHALTPELMNKLERAARRESRRRGEPRDREQIPFGFAAFTSLAQGEPSIVPQAPTEPTE